MRHVVASLLALVATVWIASVAHAAGPVTLPLLAGQQDPAPGASVYADFIGGRYKAGGKVTSRFTGMTGLTVVANSFRYGENADGSLVPFEANAPRLTTQGLGTFEVTTNLFPRSQEFSNASWAKSNVTVSNPDNIAAPDGTITGTLATATTTQPRLERDIAATVSTTYVLTAYMKAGTAAHGGFGYFDGAANHYISYNLQSCQYEGVFGTELTTLGTAQSINGWCRIAAKLVTPASVAGASGIKLLFSDISVANSSPTGTAGVTAYLWGADARAVGSSGATIVPYCPTAGSSATCAADVVQVPFTPGTVGSAYIQAKFGASQSGTPRMLTATNALMSAGGYGFGSGNTFQAFNGAANVNTGTVNLIPGMAIKAAYAWDASGRTIVANGIPPAAAATDANGVGGGSIVTIGSGNGTSHNGYIQAFALYSTTLTTAQMQAMTAGPDTSSLNLNFASGVYKAATPYVRTNYIPDFSAWTISTAALTAAAGTAPDGTLTAYKLVPANSTSAKNFFLDSSAASAGVYSYSLWAKASGYNYAMVRGFATNGGRFLAMFDLTTCTYLSQSTASSPTLTNYAAEGVGNGWCRLQVQMNTSSTGVSNAQIMTMASPTAAPTLNAALDMTTAGDGTSGILIWHPQVELSGKASSFIGFAPSATQSTGTTTTQSTNPADVGNLTFTNSTGGYVPWANGTLTLVPANTPRISDLGLLVEQASANLLLWSQDLTNAAWAKSGAVATAGAVTAPDATATASTLTSNSTDGLASQLVTASASTTYTGSVWLKVPSGTLNTRLSLSNQSGSTLGSATIVSLTTTWQRFTVTQATGGADTGVKLIIGGFNTIGSGVAVNMWGAQLEQFSQATSYIPTTSATASRSADVFAYSGMSNASPVALGVSVLANATASADNYLAMLDDGTANNRLLAYRTTLNKVPWNLTAGGVNFEPATSATFTPGSVAGFAGRSVTNNSQAALGSTLYTLDTTHTAPSGLTTLRIGGGISGASPANAQIGRAVIYPYAANDNELQYRSAGSW